MAAAKGTIAMTPVPAFETMAPSGDSATGAPDRAEVTRPR